MGIEVDDSARRVAITAGPGFSGRILAEAVKRMFEETPQTGAYDFVLDLRETETGATLEDYRIVAEAYARLPKAPGRRYTCFVTLDQHYPLWAASLQHLFPDREQKFFVTAESAGKFLDQARN